MFFDELPPDTSVYMVAGYTLFFLITLVYVASLFIRTRNLDQDLATLETLQKEKQAVETKAASSKRKPARAKSGNARKSPRKVAGKR